MTAVSVPTPPVATLFVEIYSDGEYNGNPYFKARRVSVCPATVQGGHSDQESQNLPIAVIAFDFDGNPQLGELSEWLNCRQRSTFHGSYPSWGWQEPVEGLTFPWSHHGIVAAVMQGEGNA